ncbi:MAG: DUF697 domain-containing protein [Leptolyngbya sp. SIO4C1]|nr:DUF697 domain-containing protein [Leptolyngbya sp. SIO4C1]
MAMTFKRPILVGGLGLTASFWLLDTLGHAPVDGSLAMGAIALGSGLWWLNKSRSPQIDMAAPTLVAADREAVSQALARFDSAVETLKADFAEQLEQLQPAIAALQQQKAQMLENLERDTLLISLVGHKSTGKSTLLRHLAASWQPEKTLRYAETALSDEANLVDPNSDLVLFLIAGDLTESELQSLQSLVREGHQVLLVLSKQDQLQPTDREVVLERVRSRVQPMGVDALAAAAAPGPIKVRRHLNSGEVQESLEQPAPQTAALTQVLSTLSTEKSAQLVMATGLRQAKALRHQAIDLLNAQRRQKAMPMIEQMQWIAAGTAFANPLATLDLLAAAAINAQLVLDIGAIYGQKFSLDQAKAAAGTLAELTVKLGLVELATQALGSVLKGHATTYVAGGLLQGVSAAYLTRVAGLALIDFFQAQSLLEPPERQFSFEQLGERLQTGFQQVRQGTALSSFVNQTLKHLPVGNAIA